MINFLDVYERAIKGPIMSEKDFDMKVFIPKLKNVVKTYGIQYDKGLPVPSDDRAADNLYKAAIDFFSQVGVYCQDTNRIIQFTGMPRMLSRAGMLIEFTSAIDAYPSILLVAISSDVVTIPDPTWSHGTFRSSGFLIPKTPASLPSPTKHLPGASLTASRISF